MARRVLVSREEFSSEEFSRRVPLPELPRSPRARPRAPRSGNLFKKTGFLYATPPRRRARLPHAVRSGRGARRAPLPRAARLRRRRRATVARRRRRRRRWLLGGAQEAYPQPPAKYDDPEENARISLTLDLVDTEGRRSSSRRRRLPPRSRCSLRRCLLLRRRHLGAMPRWQQQPASHHCAHHRIRSSHHALNSSRVMAKRELAASPP